MNKHWSQTFSIALIFALMLSLAPGFSSPVQAISTGVVISQVYGGGGNTGAPYTNDYIELFNRGTSTVSLTGWSLQYTSATGTGLFGSSSTLITPLSGSLAPGQYLLVQEAPGTSCSGSPCGSPLPTADLTDGSPINMAAGGGKVALVNTATPLGCNGSSTPCTPAALATIVDLIGWDGANYFEGAGPGPTTANGTSAIRQQNGCQDTDNNSADFIISNPPNPRNTASPFYICPTDAAPYVASTVPANGATEVPLNSNITVTFSETVNVAGSWFGLSCASSGAHTATVSGGPTSFTLNPSSDFVPGENCTLTIYAANVTDQDLIDPPDNMTINFTAGFTTVAPPQPIGTVNGVVLDTDNGITHVSPYVGQTVTIQGVIYEKTLQAISNSSNTYKGFYIQNTSATADGNPRTSDGLFVFMSTSSTINGPSGPYTPMVGDEIVLSGKVSEYFNMTELVGPLTVKAIVRTGVDIEAEIPPVVADPQAGLADANRYWERLQGMRVQVPQNSIVLGGRNVFNPADAEIWVASPDSTIALRTDPYTRRAFRDAHPLDDNYDATNWDGNGYRILMGSLGIKGAAGNAQALIDPARTFDTVTNSPSGGLNYTFSKYRIEITTQPVLDDGPNPTSNHPPQAFNRGAEYSIADYNLENLYDYRDNPFSGCDFTGNSGCPKVDPFLAAINPPYDYVPASDAAYQARLNDIANQIINDLHGPDILMVQEVENQDICTVTDGALTCGAADNADGKPDVLQELALKIATLGGPSYDAAFDRNSSDLRGIAPSFMYRTDRVVLLPPDGDPVLGMSPAIGSYTPVPYDNDVSNPKTLNAVYTGTGACETSWVFPRAPDIGLFRIYNVSVGTGNYRDVYVINNHFKSGPDTCVAHRTEQARYNAALVAYIQAANPNARIVLGGDLNVYPRPDDIALGASDQLGSLYDPSLGLKNLWEVELAQAPEAAYSYVYLGMAQTLDQMFVSQPMLAELQQVHVAHINSDFAADYPDDVARGTSDHDPSVATFTINYPPTVDAGGPYAVGEGSSITLTAIGTDPENGPLTYAWDLDNDGTFETPGQSAIFDAALLTAPATYTVKVQVTDDGGLTAVDSAAVNVMYNFNGFFQPVGNLPTLNTARAGQAIPVKFSLTGDQGLDIFATGYPTSQQIACDSNNPQGDIEETINAGSSSLTYDPTTDTYIYVWKTDKAWAGTCRQLTIKLNDGTIHQANFKFGK